MFGPGRLSNRKGGSWKVRLDSGAIGWVFTSDILVIDLTL